MGGSGHLGKLLRSLFEVVVLIGAKATSAARDLPPHSSPPLHTHTPQTLEALQSCSLDKDVSSTDAGWDPDLETYY